MTQKLGTVDINRKILGVNSLNKIMLGANEIWPNVVAPVASLIFVESQPGLLTGATTNSIPINGTNLAVGDTVIVIVRSDNATPITATLGAGNTVTLLVSRANGYADALTIWKFEVVAGQAGIASFSMTLNITASMYADVMVVRGKALPNRHAFTSNVNTASITVPVAGIPINNGQSLLVAGFNSTATTPASITSTSCSPHAISGDLGTPKIGITGFVCIVEEGALADAVISSAPVAAGQILEGVWLN